jgi:hypothetical protein
VFLATARCPDIFCKFLLLLHWENCNPFNSLEILIVSRFMIYATSRYHKVCSTMLAPLLNILNIYKTSQIVRSRNENVRQEVWICIKLKQKYLLKVPKSVHPRSATKWYLILQQLWK